MRRILRHRPSPAMVVACLALAVALGGTSYAAVSLPRNSVGTKQLRTNAVTSIKVRNNALTGADIFEARLGRVPSATRAVNATNAANATTASTAASATNAANAGLLDGVDSTGFVKPGSSEAWREVGSAGQPPFDSSWVNHSPATLTTAAFYKDPLDTVHLKGAVNGGAGSIFTLPDGYRPTKQPCPSTVRGEPGTGFTPTLVCIGPDGSVVPFHPASGTGPLYLDGLSFRLGS